MSSINPVNRSMNGIKTIETSEVIFTDDNSSLNTSAGIVSAQANSTTALNGKINSVGFNTNNGVLTLTKEDTTTLTTDLDGRYLESVAIDDIPNLPASKITTGILADARIPDLNADKITAGTLAEARIPDLPASKITTGTLILARIPDLNADKITAGTLGDARIPDLPASKITAGTLALARIPTLPYVSTSGNETITGLKTFSSVPICSTQPTNNNQLVNKEYVDNLISSIPTFNPATNYTFSGNNTFTGTNTFTDALIEGQVVQTISNHERREIQTTATNNEGASEDYYVNLGRTPTNFYVRIVPKNSNSWIRVSVVVHISMNANLTQNSYWNGVRLFRQNTHIADANNSRGTGSSYIKGDGSCWVMNTYGASTSNNFGSNFVNQISGTYIDKSPPPNQEYIEYSIAIRPNIYAQYPTTAQQQIRLNGSFNQGSGGAERPAPTSFIQVEEIYKTS